MVEGATLCLNRRRGASMFKRFFFSADSAVSFLMSLIPLLARFPSVQTWRFRVDQDPAQPTLATS